MATSLFITAALISFILNLIWEFSHSGLYDWKKPPLKNKKSFKRNKLLVSSLGDLIYSIIILGTVSVISGGSFWIENPRFLQYFLLVITGIILAAFIEVKAKWLNKWSYSSKMPKIIGIGLTPLIQLAITNVLAVVIVSSFAS